ncbi:MAG TPA: bifunctional phosphopantothenoylcysteine decarboxylase/phosphopantothenate--cysteine ligase CoaBC, partial [Candidatus Binatus sp.]|nr:bifunctional phosphopantothenoylcysteine decarboxylase/phosphopantothenate--cysteine ligase CoaBC [Candidatus Binatus sp.]
TGRELTGRKIALLVTSSVASYKSPDIARELMRHGAQVHVVVTRSAEKLIGVNLLEWATGNPVVRELTGKLEHIQLAGNSPERVDLVLIAPATANTIGKIACGIDDTPVTTVATVAIGSKIPVLIAPAMHEPMYDHPIIQENIERLKGIGVWFVDPEISEGKAKLASTEIIVKTVIDRLSGQKRDLEGRRVLVTAGPTLEPIDPVRLITNKSSGKMGIAIADEVASRGASTILVLGPTQTNASNAVRTVRVETTEEMLRATINELKRAKYDLMFAAAAPSDYKLTTPFQTKVKTRQNKKLSIELESTPKILAEVKRTSPDTLVVAFKTEHGVSDEELVSEAFNAISEKNADLVAANDVSRQGVGFRTETNELFVVDSSKKVVHIPLADKREVARQLVDIAVKKLRH